MSKPRRVPNKCMFCDSEASRKGEHLWSDWMAPYFKDIEPKRRANRWEDKRGQWIHEQGKWEGGPLTTMRIAFVCIPCNTTWMSRLEQAVKPVLVRMIDGDEFSLSAADRKVLGDWFMLKTMVGEWDVPKNVAISAANRKSFKENLTYPPYTLMFVGRSTAIEWDTGYKHIGTSRLHPAIVPYLPLEGVGHNSQATTFCVKGVVFHCRTSTIGAWPEGLGNIGRNVVVLHPNSSPDNSSWPPEPLPPREIESFCFPFGKRRSFYGGWIN